MGVRRRREGTKGRWTREKGKKFANQGPFELSVCVFLRPCQACRGKAARGQGEARFEWGRLGTRGSASVTQCASRCVQSASFVAAAAVSHPLCSNFAAPEPRRHTGHARLDFSSRYHIVAGFGRSGMTLSHHKRRAPQVAPTAHTQIHAESHQIASCHQSSRN